MSPHDWFLVCMTVVCVVSAVTSYWMLRQVNAELRRYLDELQKLQESPPCHD